jgi:hypothetical protein
MGESLGRELVKTGLLKEAQLQEAEKYQDETGAGLARILVKLRMVKEADLLDHVARREGLDVVKLEDDGSQAGRLALTHPTVVADGDGKDKEEDKGKDDGKDKKAARDAATLTLDEEILKTLSPELVEKHELVPVGHDKTHLKLALPDPSDLMAVEEVRFMTGREVQVMLISETDALKILSKYYNKDLKPVASKLHSRTEARRIVRQVGQHMKASEAARTIGSLEVSPAKLIKALATLLIDKGVVGADELRERLQVME